MNLVDFIEKYKTGLPFTYSVTDTELQITFDKLHNIKGSFLRVPSELEYFEFIGLLENRRCKWIGNELIKSSLEVIQIDRVTVF